MKRVKSLAIVILALVAIKAQAADVVQSLSARRLPEAGTPTKLKGLATAIDGKTLWFPTYGRSVHLAGIDGCELPQWAFSPKMPEGAISRALAPIPCGAMAKAWLKRSTGSRSVSCDIAHSAIDDHLVGTCIAGDQDLARELLRVGWARLDPSGEPRADYAEAQRYAVSARYGIWGTYVLDMNEWRAKAVDRTLDRRPAADVNLLKERKAEITPPFADARQAPARTDR
jgi:endonuclease YncB( thermonuclease family)